MGSVPSGPSDQTTKESKVNRGRDGRDGEAVLMRVNTDLFRMGAFEESGACQSWRGRFMIQGNVLAVEKEYFLRNAVVRESIEGMVRRGLEL